MKKVLIVFLSIVLFASCDDGDLNQVSFAFNDTLAGVCGSGTNAFFIHKTQDNRALIIQLPESNFKNSLTVDSPNPPVTLDINGGSVQLIYREYSGPITGGDLCSVIPIAEPTVVREQEAVAGKIRIITTAIKTEPDANGVTQITHFQHTLTFTDLTFDLGDGNSQVNEAIAPVRFQTVARGFTNFAGLTGVLFCDNTFLYKYDPTQSLILDLSDADAAILFSNEAGPKRRVFSANTKLRHSFYDTALNSLSEAYFCANPTPLVPPVSEFFTAVDGVENVSGIIEVTSLASDNGSKHTIVFKNVRLAKGTLTRELGNVFVFGEFETIN